MATKRLRRDLIKALDRSVSKKALKPVARKAAQIIYRRVKSGRGVVNANKVPAKATRLKKLSDKYKSRRKKVGVKGKFGTPGKSNLTFTGQMLEALEGEAKKQRIEIFINDSDRSDSDSSNSEIAEFVQEQGRPFLSLTKAELNIIIQELDEVLQRELNKV